jgi:hypothetical protein
MPPKHAPHGYRLLIQLFDAPDRPVKDETQARAAIVKIFGDRYQDVRLVRGVYRAPNDYKRSKKAGLQYDTTWTFNVDGGYMAFVAKSDEWMRVRGA